MADGEGSRNLKPWLLLGVLALAGLAVVVWMQRRAAENEGAQAAATAAAPRAVHATAAPAPEPSAARSMSDELCGVSADQVRAPGESVEQQVARLAEPAMARWRKELSEGASKRSRAMGLALRNANPAQAAAPQTPADAATDSELVLLATESDDPAIYALALGQCGEGDPQLAAGPCQGLSLEHWAKIDAENAAPWLWIAARADAANNRQLTDAALTRGAAAPRLDSYVGTLTALALGALPREVRPLEKAVAGADLMAIAHVAPFELAVHVCAEEALQDAARKKACGSVAKLFATQGTTLAEISIAWRIEERLGLPEEQWIGLQDEQRSFTRGLSDPWRSAEGGGSFACPVIKNYDFFIDQLAANGGNEREAMKATAALAKEDAPAPDAAPPPGPPATQPL